MAYSIGVDIGGTKVAAGIVTREGSVLKKLEFPTPKDSSQSILKLVKAMIEDLYEHAAESDIQLTGIGIGSAGQINKADGTILSGTENIKDWNAIAIVSYLKQYFNTEIYLDNDGNTFAVGEYLLGNGKNTENLVCITIGTGIGGGVISQGQLLNGSWGGAGELGHTSVNFKGPKCNCGLNGCVETYASGTGIANRFNENFSTEINVNPLPTSKEVFDWYHEGREEAIEIIDQAILALSHATVNYIHVFNPEKVIFGGGIMEKHPWLLEKIQQKMIGLGMDTLTQVVEFSLSGLGPNSGLVGASQQVWLKKRGE